MDDYTREILTDYAINVKGFQRKTKSGKMSNVKQHTRKGDKKVDQPNDDSNGPKYKDPDYIARQKKLYFAGKQSKDDISKGVTIKGLEATTIEGVLELFKDKKGYKLPDNYNELNERYNRMLKDLKNFIVDYGGIKLARESVIYNEFVKTMAKMLGDFFDQLYATTDVNKEPEPTKVQTPEPTSDYDKAKVYISKVGEEVKQHYFKLSNVVGYNKLPTKFRNIYNDTITRLDPLYEGIKHQLYGLYINKDNYTETVDKIKKMVTILDEMEQKTVDKATASTKLKPTVNFSADMSKDESYLGMYQYDYDKKIQQFIDSIPPNAAKIMGSLNGLNPLHIFGPTDNGDNRQDISNLYGGRKIEDTLGGFYNTNGEIVVLYGTSIFAKDTLIHELSHSYDYEYLKVFKPKICTKIHETYQQYKEYYDSDEFMHLKADNKYPIPRDYALTNKEEFVACLLEAYIDNKISFKRNYSQLVDFVEEILNP